MDDQQPADAEGPGPHGPGDADALRPVVDPTHGGPEAHALAAEAQEIRRLVEAGAGSPEELRALAERLRAHRAREDALWRAQVKPTLKVKRGSSLPRADDRDGVPAGPASSPRQSLVLGFGLLGLVGFVVLLAASSSVVWVLLPVVVVLAAAWWQGKQAR